VFPAAKPVVVSVVRRPCAKYRSRDLVKGVTKRGQAALDQVGTSGTFCCVIITFVTPPLLPVASDEGVGRAVLAERRLLHALQLGDDPLRERLPELDAH
jgi:hypothetical protein